MDTNNLILWGMGVVLIAIGVPLFYLSRYLSAPEDKKKRRALDLKIIGIVWMALGVVIYMLVLAPRFAAGS
jgi:uncharacterized protein YjeT (DUF2065 family)